MKLLITVVFPAQNNIFLHKVGKSVPSPHTNPVVNTEVGYAEFGKLKLERDSKQAGS